MSDTSAETGLDPTAEPKRPQTRADCQKVPRPCPWVGCKHHLLLEVYEGGAIAIASRRRARDGRPVSLYVRPRPSPMIIGRFCDQAVATLERLQDTCALDVAERGGHTLAETGAFMGNVTREHVRQIEVRGLKKLRLRKEESQ